MKEREEITLSESAANLPLSKSTLHCYLGTLLNEEYVIKEDGEYVLSLKSLNLEGYARERKNGYKAGKKT